MGLPTVELSALASVVLVAWVGFAAHRASLCTVRAVAEILSSGTAWMLASFAKAALWTLAVSGLVLLLSPLSGAPVQQTLPHAVALAGGLVFGIGAALNGGCSLSTLQRLADGDLSMFGTLAGFVAGVFAWSMLNHPLELTTLTTQAVLWDRQSIWAAPVLILIWLWGVREIIRLWRPTAEPTAVSALAALRQRLSAPVYRLSSSAAILGVAGGVLYTVQGAWTYTNFLRAEAVSWQGAGVAPSTLHGTLLVALLAGMVLSSLQRHSFALQFDWRVCAGRRVAGGLLMGVGGAVIPGGNDTLILAAIPTLSPWSLATYIALLTGVAAALLAMRAFTGLQLRVDCTGDRCH
ncbi:MAG: YeeE/YedE family protein [Rhodocyclales bacterium]|nr:YeeE/YedE family protein [Rhodocyclales bacterium]